MLSKHICSYFTGEKIGFMIYYRSSSTVGKRSWFVLIDSWGFIYIVSYNSIYILKYDGHIACDFALNSTTLTDSYGVHVADFLLMHKMKLIIVQMWLQSPCQNYRYSILVHQHELHNPTQPITTLSLMIPTLRWVTQWRYKMKMI